MEPFHFLTSIALERKGNSYDVYIKKIFLDICVAFCWLQIVESLAFERAYVESSRRLKFVVYII